MDLTATYLGFIFTSAGLQVWAGFREEILSIFCASNQMGVLQIIGKMTGAAKASSLRTPFVAALVVLIVIWSMLSLDMTSVKAPSMVGSASGVCWNDRC